jgi:DeoR/GlpR family transcriptional regulator of sugar metabolism
MRGHPRLDGTGTPGGSQHGQGLHGLQQLQRGEGREHARHHHAEAKKLVMSIAAKVILLFDSSKMGCTSFALFVLLQAVDTIATDAIGAQDRARLVESGNGVLLAEFGAAASSAGSGG